MQFSQEVTIFLVLIAGAVLMILGLGVTLTFGLYNLDKGVRTSGTATARLRRARKGGITPSLSPVSEAILSKGSVTERPSMGLRHSKVGMWMFIASEVMFFTALIGAYVAFRVGGRVVVPYESLNLPLATLNTFLLLSSSFTVVMALDAILEGKESQFLIFILLSLLLGGVFISIQGVEWAELIGHGVTANSDLFGTSFFVITGFHGLHVAIGLIWLVFLLLKGFRGDFTPEDSQAIENFGLYWHFVDIVWIVLFTIIYLV